MEAKSRPLSPKSSTAYSYSIVPIKAAIFLLNSSSLEKSSIFPAGICWSARSTEIVVAIS
nr:hypothetical protein [Niallia taxi]